MCRYEERAARARARESAEPEPGYFFVFGQPVTVVRPGRSGRPQGPGSGAMPRGRLLEADRPERVGRRCAVAILVELDLPRDALVTVSGVRERGAKRGGVAFAPAATSARTPTWTASYAASPNASTVALARRVIRSSSAW